MASAKAVAENRDPSLMLYTPASASEDRITIANRLNIAIRQVPQNLTALGLLTSSTEPEAHVAVLQPEPSVPVEQTAERARQRIPYESVV